MKTLAQVNSRAKYTFDPRDVGRQRKKIHVQISRAISIWSSIESLTSNIIMNALGADVIVGAEMFLSITSAPAANAVLKTAVRLGIKPKYAELFNALWTINGELIEERHKLAHWILGFSKEVPNALLLFNPKDGFRRGAYNITFWHHGQHERFIPRQINKIRVLSSDYLEELISEFLAQLYRVDAFLNLLRLDVTADVPASVIQRQYDQLYNEPRIHQILLLARADQKNKKAAQRRRARASRQKKTG